jgi:hypothetical protein
VSALSQRNTDVNQQTNKTKTKINQTAKVQPRIHPDIAHHLGLPNHNMVFCARATHHSTRRCGQTDSCEYNRAVLRNTPRLRCCRERTTTERCCGTHLACVAAERERNIERWYPSIHRKPAAPVHPPVAPRRNLMPQRWLRGECARALVSPSPRATHDLCH